MAKRPNKTIDAFFSKKNKSSSTDSPPINTQSQGEGAASACNNEANTAVANEASTCGGISGGQAELQTNNAPAPAPAEPNERDPCLGPENALQNIASGPYQPIIDFPAKSTTNDKMPVRKFRKEWYSEFTFLEYSVRDDRAFCFPCRAFGHDRMEPAFRSKGFQAWHKATSTFRDHSKRPHHLDATAKWQGYVQSLQKGSVAAQLDSQRHAAVKENQEYLTTVIESILFCARQGIPLRGHDEGEGSNNQGNLRELMKLRSKDNEQTRRFLTQREKFYTYMNSATQNEIIEIMAQQVLESIIKEVKDACIFSIIADETMDLSRHEQVALIVRYVSHALIVNERFIGFYRTVRTDGASLAALIKNTLETLGLDLSSLRGQCYDGAASMRGPYKGVASRILNENSLAFYVHCHAHILNLCIVDMASSVPAVRNAFGTLQTLRNFIEGSAKRHSVLEKLTAAKQFAGGAKTLKSLSDTRWNCRVEAIKAVLDNFEEIVEALSEIAESGSKVGAEANALLKSVQDFGFIYCLVFMRRVLVVTDTLNKMLQAKNLNYDSAQALVKATVKTIEEMRGDAFARQTFDFVRQLCDKNGFAGPSVPRKGIPAKRGGGDKTTFDNPEDYYRCEVLYRTLDTLTQQLRDRFSENEMHVLQCLSDLVNSPGMPTDASLKSVCQTYNMDAEALGNEITLFNKMLNDEQPKDDHLSSFEKRLKYFEETALENAFLNLQKLYRLYLTIPVTSASAERSFSTLRQMKTYLRTTMTDTRVSNLGILQIEKAQEISIARVIEKYASTKNRKLQFTA